MLTVVAVLANFLSRLAAVGLAYYLSFRVLSRWGNVVAAMAAGLLLSIACTHLLPEALASGISVATGGYVLLASLTAFFLLECILSRFAGHSHGRPEVKSVPALLGGGKRVVTHVHAPREGSGGAAAMLLGTACHNFVDGLLVAAAFATDYSSGIIVTTAIFAHELPQVLGQLVVLNQTGMERRKAGLWTLVVAMAAVAGGFVGSLLFVVSETLVGYAMIVSAASFLYVVLSVLLPEVAHAHEEGRGGMPFKEIAGMLAGIVLSVFILMPLHEGSHAQSECPSHSKVEAAHEGL